MKKEIFSKEVLTIADIQELFGVSYCTAARIMREIKATSDRINIKGIVHVQDYCEHFRLNVSDYLK